MKTTRDYINDFKPEVAETMLNYANANDEGRENLDQPLKPAAVELYASGGIGKHGVAVASIFRFDETKEGAEYWMNICENADEYLK